MIQSVQAQTPTDTELATEIQTFVEQLAANDQFSGTVLVSKNGERIFQGAYGLASKAFNVPNQLDTKFNLGSMNKMITAVAIAQLASEGKLSYDDTISKHVSNYPNKDVAEKVTIHQLLTHTSGLPDYFNNDYTNASRENFRTVRDFLILFAEKSLEFTPGITHSYSNSNFIVLGIIIEEISGETYFDYVREHIYEPLGMINTDAYEMDFDTPNLAIGYTTTSDLMTGASLPVDKGRKNNLFMHVIKGGPAGGGFSTVEDLTRFGEALLNYTLLSEEDTNTVTTGKEPLPGSQNVSYAYGFVDETINGYRRFGHGGGFPGINGQLHVYPELGYVVAVLANYDPPAAEMVAERIGKLITNSEIPSAMNFPVEKLQNYANSYTGPGFNVEMVVDKDALWLVLNGNERHKFLPLSETEFFDEQFLDVRIKFTLDEQGKATETVLENAGGPGSRETFRIKE